MLYWYLVFLPLVLFSLFLASSLWVELAYWNVPEQSLEVRLALSWHWGRRILTVPFSFYLWKPDQDRPQRKTLARPHPSVFSLERRDLLFWLNLTAVFLRKTRVELSGRFRFGTGDAAYTGFAAGLLWSAQGLAQTAVRTFCRGGHVRIKVEPEFQASCLDANLRCIVVVPMTHIISVTGRAAIYLRRKQAGKNRRGGSIRGGASYSRPHENGHGKHQRYG